MRETNFPRVLVLITVILIGLPGICSAASAETITVHMERGQQHYQSGGYEAALKEFRTVTEIDPGYIKGWENMCWTYCKMGETDKALEIWESLKAVHPDRTKLLNVIGDTYASKGEYEQTLAAYEESLEAKPAQVDILAARCRVLYWAGRNEDAFIRCRELLSSHPEQDEIRQLLAKLQMSQQVTDYEAAINNWQYLIQKRPEDLQLQVELAKAYYRNESYLQAYETAERVSEQDSKNVPVLEILLNASILLQKYERAQDVIKELRTADPNNPGITKLQAKIHDGVAQRFFQQGDYNKALEEFLKAEALAPELPGLSENIGWTYRHLGQIDEAIRVWEQLLESQSENVHMLNLLAGAYADKEMYDKALLMYERSLKTNPAQKEIRFASSRIKRWIGRFHESADELSRLVVEYPENATIRYQFALCLMRLERYEEAMEHFKELSVTNPEESQYIMGTAGALYLSGQHQEALKIANDILAKDPWNLEALDFLADDAESLGDYKKACQLLESAVMIDGNDIARLNKLADCAANIDDYPVVEKTTEKSLKLLATQPEVRMLYADSLRINGKVDKAIKQYRMVLKCNPNHIPALVGLKECCVIKEDFEKGLEYLERVLSIDQTNFHLTLEKSKLLAYSGEYDKSVNILLDLLERSKTQETVFVLLYHGLSRNQKSGTLRLSNFRAQMEVLSELGYSAVTIDDLLSAWKGERKLPDKAVLITFDDARRDSFECAGPVLEEFSFRATMFVPVCIVEAQDPAYCNWQQLKYYAGTGRWDIQSHGNFAHGDVVIDTTGNRGTFLTHRKWLSDGNRLENDLEFHQRIDSDYRESREILESRLSKNVNAFAFPRGWYGQEECADIEVVTSNLTAVDKYFDLSFVQDKHGAISRAYSRKRSGQAC
jgi:tetratricopeptide (TPR) repeat protein